MLKRCWWSRDYLQIHNAKTRVEQQDVCSSHCSKSWNKEVRTSQSHRSVGGEFLVLQISRCKSSRLTLCHQRGKTWVWSHWLDCLCREGLKTECFNFIKHAVNGLWTLKWPFILKIQMSWPLHMQQYSGKRSQGDY